MRPTWLALGVLAVGALLAAMPGPFAHVRRTATTPAIAPSSAAAAEENAAANEKALAEANEGLLHGRVTTDDAVYEGRLRWGGDEEALWGTSGNGGSAPSSSS